MVGDVLFLDGAELEVVWDGKGELLDSRPTKPSQFWVRPNRLYNKKSDYWSKPRSKKTLDNSLEQLDNEAQEGKYAMFYVTVVKEVSWNVAVEAEDEMGAEVKAVSMDLRLENTDHIFESEVIDVKEVKRHVE